MKSYKEEAGSTSVKVPKGLQENAGFFRTIGPEVKGTASYLNYCKCILVSHGSTIKGMDTSLHIHCKVNQTSCLLPQSLSFHVFLAGSTCSVTALQTCNNSMDSLGSTTQMSMELVN